MRLASRAVAVSSALFLSACQANPPMKPVDSVDLERFMGDWYVIANIPTFIEKGAHNAVESYRLANDGTIETTFTFRDGSFDGKEKVYRPKGFVVDGTNNAVWGMQFIWPIKGDYRVIHLDEDYTTTVIGREKRDYVWLMARTPDLPEADYAAALESIRTAGYDMSQLQTVPQQW